MAYKTVLFAIAEPEHAERMVDYVGPQLEAWGSHVIGVHTEAIPAAFLVPGGFPDAGYLDIAVKKNAEHAAACKAAADKAFERHGISIEWRAYNNSNSGDTAEAAVSSAYRSDLVVAMQQDSENTSGGFTRVEKLLFETGRPVLLVPHTGNKPDTLKRAMVAWNGTREAARAVFDALPYLKAAAECEVFVIDPEDTRDQSAPYAGSEIAAALARHGVNVSVRIEKSVEISVAAAIENRISETGVDLLVMGAYGHSRLREMVFGGVTRTILNSMPVMTLMSH